MLDILKNFHSKEYIDKILDEIRDILLELYGKEAGTDNYSHLLTAAGTYLKSLNNEELETYAAFNPANPYDALKGKVFAITYPDNIYDDSTPTLKTLGSVLSDYFPSVNGMHILPERIMSHPDVWPQDLLHLISRENAMELISNLQKSGVLNEDRYITDKYQDNRENLKLSLSDSIVDVLDRAYNYHFNDGGFSQITRAMVDPRFGTADDIRNLSKRFSIMLDYVVNHLDIDNDVLEAYRHGNNSGNAFIIISPAEYSTARNDGSLYKTFRPRPFPLYTGLRKYPISDRNMNSNFEAAGLSSIDERIINFLSIYFKVVNDQGLSSEDKRIFAAFKEWIQEKEMNEGLLFEKSTIQANQQILKPEFCDNIFSFLEIIGFSSDYGTVFNNTENEVFGEKFFVYTTFSESQVDINPLTVEGFNMIIDDLFHLLSSGQLSMMRMDAIKYLWKKKGGKNFDMQEGNKFIDLIRKLMALISPSVLPLDEVNSPDPVVYKMEEGGGFAYLFGPVNSTIIAINEGTLQPLKSYYELYKKEAPLNFVPFIMLSTHDGRSVQGLGVQRTDGHVSINQFYHLKNVITDRGGMSKYRTVPAGEIASDTFNKVLDEANLIGLKDQLLNLFTEDSVASKNVLVLKDSYKSRDMLLSQISDISGQSTFELLKIPSIDYFLDWIVAGRTVYELCSTSRSSLRTGLIDGSAILPEMEAFRLALAQCFVLTIGQAVPAIYFNDLLGLKNDRRGYEISGKPRDLNRHKNYLPDMDLLNPAGPFQKTYLTLINKIIDLRTKDNAFYPGSEKFEFMALTDTLFLNHPYHNGDHSLILGNISEKHVLYLLDLSTLAAVDEEWIALKREQHLTDGFSGAEFMLSIQGTLNLILPPYGMLWLK